MPTAGRDPRARLYGRQVECRTLDQSVAMIRGGHSSVLVVRGEAGIGKTALLEYVSGTASGCRIARAAGAEFEMEFAFGGLHQLCAPFLAASTSCPTRTAPRSRRRSG